MDPFSLAAFLKYAQLLLNVAPLLNQMSENSPPLNPPEISRPSTVNAAAPQDSFADLSTGILRCYHHTARYQLADVVESPWTRQSQYRADDSVLVRIQYFDGSSGQHHQMDVAVLARNDPSQMRTAVLSDSDPYRWDPKCQFERWTQLAPKETRKQPAGKQPAGEPGE
jgi:hypothetical protein